MPAPVALLPLLHLMIVLGLSSGVVMGAFVRVVTVVRSNDA